MALFQDLRRVVNGLSMVAKELANHSQTLENARNGDFQAIISSSVKKAVVSATDLARITKGKVQQYSKPRPKETVVYFTNEPENAPTNSTHGEEADFQSTVEGATRRAEALGDQAWKKGVYLEKTQEKGDFDISDQVRIEQSVFDSNVPNNTSELDAGRRTTSEDFKEIGLTQDPTPLISKEKSDGVETKPLERRRPRERRVPSTPFGRALGFAGLGAGLAWGTLQESAKRIVFGKSDLEEKQSAHSPFVSEKNAERLALALCRMRGAALKLGQMLSIQDESLIPAPILSALDIVRQGADVMPRSQLNQVLDKELGPNWSSKLSSFDYEPVAAASIGQVHRAVTKDGLEVAMKIQYPGVANSIESDVENVRRLLDYTNLIPKGLYLDRAMKVAKEELSRECDYELEAANQKRFRKLSSNLEGFYVPMVIDDISSRRVLTTEFVSGVPIDKVAALNQDTRNYVGKKLLELTLKELFVFRFMQTDPNWSNFLFDENTKMINLIDFGAARDYPKRFVDDYLRMVLACSNCDRDAVIRMSQRLGFLTGMESDVMLDAHVQAGFIVGMPFKREGGYDFRVNNITNSISNLGATMLKHRLTPPPDEAYSLHRKLSGAFLACIKLGAVVPCRELLLQVYQQYHFGDPDAEVLAGSAS